MEVVAHGRRLHMGGGCTWEEVAHGRRLRMGVVAHGRMLRMGVIEENKQKQSIANNTT